MKQVIIILILHNSDELNPEEHVFKKAVKMGGRGGDMKNFPNSDKNKGGP